MNILSFMSLDGKYAFIETNNICNMQNTEHSVCLDLLKLKYELRAPPLSKHLQSTDTAM